MSIENTQDPKQPAIPPLPASAGSAYRMLAEGEIIQDGDYFLDDAGMWRQTICAGQAAPNPAFTAHRQYRRYTPNHRIDRASK